MARLPVLSELCLPLTRVGGAFCAMKSVGSDEEIAASRRAIATLGGEIDRLDDIALPGAEVTHRLVWVRKARPPPPATPAPIARSRPNPYKSINVSLGRAASGRLFLIARRKISRKYFPAYLQNVSNAVEGASDPVDWGPALAIGPERFCLKAG